jgi:hypothetical protein
VKDPTSGKSSWNATFDASAVPNGWCTSKSAPGGPGQALSLYLYREEDGQRHLKAVRPLGILEVTDPVKPIPLHFDVVLPGSDPGALLDGVTHAEVVIEADEWSRCP